MSIVHKIDQVLDHSIMVIQTDKCHTIDIAGLRRDCNNNRNIPGSTEIYHCFRQKLVQILYIGQVKSLVLLYHVSAVACKTLILYARHQKEQRATLFHAHATPSSLLFHLQTKPKTFKLEVYCDGTQGQRISDYSDGHFGFITLNTCGSPHVFRTLSILFPEELINFSMFLFALQPQKFYLQSKRQMSYYISRNK